MEDELAKRDVATGRVSPVFLRNPIPGEFAIKKTPLVSVEHDPVNGGASMDVWAPDADWSHRYVLVDFPQGGYRRRLGFTDQLLTESTGNILNFGP